MVSENPFIDMDVGLIIGVVPFLAARNTPHASHRPVSD